MNCDQRFDRLLLYTSGDLAGSEVWELEAHIRECPVCAERLASLQAAEDCVRETLSTPLTTPDLADFIMARLPEPQRNVPVRRWQWAWTGACAAAVTAAAVGMSLWMSGEPATVESPKKHQTHTAAPIVAAQPDTVDDSSKTQTDPPKVITQKPRKPIHRPRPINRPIVATIDDPHSVKPHDGKPPVDQGDTVNHAVGTKIATSTTPEPTTPAVTVPVTTEDEHNLMVEKPVPVNKHETWRPPLEPEEDARVMVELPHAGYGG